MAIKAPNQKETLKQLLQIWLKRLEDDDNIEIRGLQVEESYFPLRYDLIFETETCFPFMRASDSIPEKVEKIKRDKTPEDIKANLPPALVNSCYLGIETKVVRKGQKLWRICFKNLGRLNDDCYIPSPDILHEQVFQSYEEALSFINERCVELLLTAGEHWLPEHSYLELAEHGFVDVEDYVTEFLPHGRRTQRKHKSRHEI